MNGRHRIQMQTSYSTLPCCSKCTTLKRGWGNEESLNQEEGKTGRMSPSKHSGVLTVEEMERRKTSPLLWYRRVPSTGQGWGQANYCRSKSYGFDGVDHFRKGDGEEDIYAAFRT